jgi:hypothetical protein
VSNTSFAAPAPDGYAELFPEYDGAWDRQEACVRGLGRGGSPRMEWGGWWGWGGGYHVDHWPPGRNYKWTTGQAGLERCMQDCDETARSWTLWGIDFYPCRGINWNTRGVCQLYFAPPGALMMPTHEYGGGGVFRNFNGVTKTRDNGNWVVGNGCGKSYVRKRPGRHVYSRLVLEDPQSVSWSPDGVFVVAACRNGLVILNYNTGARNILVDGMNTAAGNADAPSADGMNFPREGREQPAVLGNVYDVSWDPSGRNIAFTDFDARRVRIFNLASKDVSTLRCHKGP